MNPPLLLPIATAVATHVGGRSDARATLATGRQRDSKRRKTLRRTFHYRWN
jgi:hypothetical protein